MTRVGDEEMEELRLKAWAAPNPRLLPTFVSMRSELMALRSVADAAKRFAEAYWDEDGAATACIAMEDALEAAGR